MRRPGRTMAVATVAAAVTLAGCGEAPLGAGPSPSPSASDGGDMSTPAVDVGASEPATSDDATQPAATEPVPDDTSKPDPEPDPDIVRPTTDAVGVQRLFITQDDAGTTFEVTSDAQVEVHLPADGGWDVRSDGDVVTIVAVSSFDETSDQVWEVRLNRTGTAVLEASAGGRTLSFTLVVAND